jgi:hypothetical protein
MAEAGQRTIKRTYVGLIVFMMVYVLGMPTLLKLMNADLAVREEAARLECRAQEPVWAIVHRDRRIEKCTESKVRAVLARHVLVPPAITLKHFAYTGVISTHHLGALIWCGAGLAQFGLPREGAAARRRHRLVGTTYMFSVALLTIGFVKIVWNDLHADNDFRALFPANVSPRRPAVHAGWLVVLSALQIWFVHTACQAWKAAKEKHHVAHRRWMIRHVGSGLWVVIMRAILGLLTVVTQVWCAVGFAPIHGEIKHMMFNGSAVVGAVISLVGAEVYLGRDRAPRTIKHDSMNHD